MLPVTAAGLSVGTSEKLVACDCSSGSSELALSGGHISLVAPPGHLLPLPPVWGAQLVSLTTLHHSA
jgi:hypothetical protein